MKVLNSSQMRAIDREAIEGIGIPGPVLMENAGREIFRELECRFPALEKENIVVVAGRGNNGGDGLVVARLLLACGAKPTVLLLAGREEVRGDAAINLQVAAKIGVDIREIRGPEDWTERRTALAGATIVVDAVFGTGLSKPAEGLYAEVIEDINACRAFKLAVDIPSGLSSDGFELIGPSVKADLTVTLAAPKIAHVFPPAEDYVGELVVADIGTPGRLFDNPELKLEIAEPSAILPVFARRRSDTHKGTYGHVLVIAGSVGKTGAAVMAAKAALKLGAGLVTVATAASCLPIVARSMVELMTEPLPETAEGTISAEAADRSAALARNKDAVLIGPGISTNPSTAEFFYGLLPRLKGPVVIDADGLNLLGLHHRAAVDLPAPARGELEDRIENQAGGQPVGDVVGEDHHRRWWRTRARARSGRRSRSRDGAHHEHADRDEGRTVGVAELLQRLDERDEEQRDNEERGRRHRGQPRPGALADAGGRLDVGPARRWCRPAR